MKLTTKKQLMARYTILFAIISLIVFYLFYKNGVTFIWGAKGQDGLSQHINALMYWGEYIRNFFFNIIHGHFRFPMWDMSIGFGADILGTLNYYAIGDPLNLIYVFSNKSNIELLYNFMLVFRLYLAGVAFIAFGHYLKKDGNGILAGSIVYIFSGTFFSFAIRHPFFLNPMIYLPLLLMGVEKIYRKEKPYLFILMVTVAAISNFYFFYMLTVAAVVYALIRFPEYKEAGFFRTLGRFSGWYLLGIGLSAVILLPVLIAFSGNARTTSDVNYFSIFLYKKSYYKQIFLQFAGFQKIYKGTNLNYAALGYCAIIALFLKRDKKRFSYKVAVVLGIVSLLSPVFAYILHGFSYPMNRWTFILALIVGMTVTEIYPDLFVLTRIQKTGILAGAVFYIVFALSLGDNMVKGKYELAILAATVLALFVLNECKMFGQEKYKHFILYAVLILTAGTSSYVQYSPKYGETISNYVKSGQAYEMLCGKEMRLIQPDKYKIQNGVYRAESLDNKVTNWSLNAHIPGITNYYSVTDKNVSETMQEFGLKSYQYKFKFRKLDMRQGLMDLYGVRYVICTKETGAKLLSDYQLLRSKDGMQLYENKNVFPFGYTYDGYLSSQTYKTLNPAQKEQALLQSAILEDDSKSADKLKKMTIPENVTCHVVGENYRIHSEKEKEKIIQIKIPKQYIKANSYIYLQGVSTEALDGKSSRHVLGVGMNKSNFQLLYGGKQVHLFNAEKNSSYDIGKRNYLVKMSRDAVKDREDTLTLKFKLKSDYYIDRISILTVDQQTEIKQIQKRKKADHLTNISYDGGNHFSGDIKASQNEILCIPITYHKGWKAYDNGKQVKSEQVNGMFEGIYLNKGDHHITLKYETPGLKIGAVVSLFSLIILFIIRKKKKFQ